MQMHEIFADIQSIWIIMHGMALLHGTKFVNKNQGGCSFLGYISGNLFRSVRLRMSEDEVWYAKYRTRQT